MNHVTLPPGYLQLTDEVVVKASHISAVVSKPVVEWNANAGTLVPKGWTVGDVTKISRLGAYVPVGSGIEVTYPGGTTFLRDVTLANFTRRMLDAIYADTQPKPGD
jgi:hypothetical protein